MTEKYQVSSHQVDAEIDVLIGLMRDIGARSFLEIGSKFGGSLWRIGRSLPKGSRIVSVDLNVNGPSLRSCIDHLKRDGYDARLVAGNSMDAETVRRAGESGPYDALFIDGNHKTMYVSSDWQHYGPMAKLVAFHDIGWRRSSPASPNRIRVPEFWNEIKQGRRHQEILLDPEQNAYGIGVIWNDDVKSC